MKSINLLIEDEVAKQIVLNDSVKACFNKPIGITHNRFDLAFKLYFLKGLEMNECSSYRTRCYKQHIKAFSDGTFTEPNNANKKSYLQFETVFKDLFRDIKDNGFDAEKSLIPLAKDGSILNGAHRTAASILCNKTVGTLQTEIPPRDFDYKYFKERGVPNNMLDIAAQTFIEFDPNSFIAIKWPAAKGFDLEVEKLLSKIAFKKMVKLNYNGAHNLLAQTYQDEPWLGSVESNYPGIKNKLVGCFPDFNEISVYIFKANNLEKVLELKDKIREIFNIGKHAIHMTDNPEETLRIGRLLLNDNAIHFLNYGKPRKYLDNELVQLTEFIDAKKAEPDKIAFRESVVMNAYGLKHSKEIDYFYIITAHQNNKNDEDIDKYYKTTLTELVDHPKNHFWYQGVKFISLNTIYQMMSFRENSNDLIDKKIIKSQLKDNKLKDKIDEIKCTLYFKKLLFIALIRSLASKVLNKLGLLQFIKNIVIKYKS